MNTTAALLIIFIIACLLGVVGIALMAPKTRQYTQDTTTHRNGRDYHDPLYALPLFLLAFALISCSSPANTPDDCTISSGIKIAPTATLAVDPDLSIPPSVSTDGGDGRVYCPTTTPPAAATPPTSFVTTQLVNLSLDKEDQTPLAAATGDDMLAVAWKQNGALHLALARGANALQVRRLDKGETMSLAFSTVNRLHVVYEKNNEIYYRYADQGAHPADQANEPVSSGRNPVIVLDRRNYAHIVYEQDGLLYHAAQVQTGVWHINQVTPGTAFTATPIRGGDFGYLVAYQASGQITLARWLVDEATGFLTPTWGHLTTIPAIPGETLTGPAHLDYQQQGDTAWAYASWVALQPAAQPTMPPYSQPIYAAANPLYPNAIANPQYIHSGLNATTWGSQQTPFQAGLYQTFTVANPGQPVTVSAYGLTDAAATADFTLRLGLDATGGTNAAASTVIWSEAVTPTTFHSFGLTAPTNSPQATVFLSAELNTPDVPAIAIWDAAAVDNGTLTNGDFEGAFIPQSTLTVPDSWTAYYQDSGNAPVSGRDLYTVYVVWSVNGGDSWSAPTAISQNRETSGSITGALQSDVYPLIGLTTNPPSVTFAYIYEAGDPPPNTDLRRFGRPYTTQCELGTDICTASPGTPLLVRGVVRPAGHLLVTPDLVAPDRAVMVWDSLQLDYRTRDILATYLALR